MADSGDSRKFKIHDAANEKAFVNNSIQTSKYSFIPLSPQFALWKNLFEQFHRYANCYFLVVAVLQMIPGLSPTGKFTTLIPLTLVLLVTFFKDAYEDYRRHKRDNEVNGQPLTVWRNNGWVDVQWRDLLVGEIVKVHKDKARGEFPADLILLWSSEEQGLCHIETSNLDGETNLKLRKTHTENSKCREPEFDVQNVAAYQGDLECQVPNKDLYKFEGKLVRGPSPEDTSAVDVSSLLLRGAKLGGSTKEIIGLSVYTGKQSKLMMNQQETRHKASKLEATTNRQIIFIFIFQLSLCSCSAVGLGVSTATFVDHWYLYADDLNPFLTALKGTATFIILFNNLIPISLYVSMEVVKILQAKLMSEDNQMYYIEGDTPADAKTSSLNEELGQVQYIFSDKTGTLTCNIMDFLKFSVGTTSYGTGTTEIGRAAAAREGKLLHDDRPAGAKLRKGFYFYDERISDVAGDDRVWNWMSQDNAADLAHFFKVLAVCHTVVTEEAADGTTEYTAASPDESCLVSGAKFLGIEFLSRDATDVMIQVRDRNGGSNVEKWQFLEVLEFNSDRKRMSIIVRSPQGQLLVLCKGADTVIYERLRKPETREEEEMRTTSLSFLEKFAADGLRTLCIAQVVLTEQQYNSWAPIYKEATESIGDRDAKVSAAAEMIEKDLVLIGTTAIEDKLQEGVPHTIELLRTAGLNVWVLTGDKQETAINIGFACALLHNSMLVYKFDEGGEEREVVAQLREFERNSLDERARDPNLDMGVVVQGGALVFITGDDSSADTQSTFLSLTANCKSVICCRVTPGQKADVVRLVKENLKKVTLSIGDGANDVAMINEAHVGIGISGLEGLQAARASDYSIGQFRFLQRLLLVHGRWSYKRVSKVILYCFYKNILLYLTQFWFCLFNSFTGKSLYDRWSLAGFNVAFTAFPIIAVGVLDRDVSQERVLNMDQFPELYDIGRLSQLFSTRVFWQFFTTAFVQSAICFFVPMLALADAIEDSSGRNLDQQWFGITAYSGVVSWSWPNHLMTWGSAGMWYVFLLVYGNLWPLGIGPDWYKMYEVVLTDSKHWLTVILTVVIALFRDVTWKFYNRAFTPTLLHKVQEWEALYSNGMLPHFNYRLMRRVCPEVIPRQRVKQKKKRRKEVLVPAKQLDASQHVPPPAQQQQPPPQQQPLARQPQPLSQPQQAHPQPQPLHASPHPQHPVDARAPLLDDSLPHPLEAMSQHASLRSALDPVEMPPLHPQPGYGVQHELPVKTHDGHTAHSLDDPFSGPLARNHQRRHTGYAFSQSDEGDQVELMASRIPPGGGSPKWAHGSGRRRVQVGSPGKVSINAKKSRNRRDRDPAAVAAGVDELIADSTSPTGHERQRSVGSPTYQHATQPPKHNATFSGPGYQPLM